jgi:integrase
MSLYKRGGVYWYKFKYGGVIIRESTGLANKELARIAERNRHTELEKSAAGIVSRKKPIMFSLAGDAWLKAKSATGDWAPKTAIIEGTNLEHLKGVFGSHLLTDITHLDVAAYWRRRQNDEASAKTISNELGTLRAILLFHDHDSQWASIRKKVKLKKAQKIGRVITADEEGELLAECRKSRSRSLPVAVTLALQTCMRHKELRLLRWRQIDFGRGIITVGKSKTEAGTNREIPMTAHAKQVLEFWAGNFPERKPNHYVFPAEQYGGKGKDEHFGFSGACVYSTDPTQPIGTWKEAWEAAKLRAGVECRFHDLRHTAITHLLEAGVNMNDVADIAGWSTSTAIRMIREVYGHVGPSSRRAAMQRLEKFYVGRAAEQQTEAKEDPSGGAQKGAQSREVKNARVH